VGLESIGRIFDVATGLEIFLSAPVTRALYFEEKRAKPHKTFVHYSLNSEKKAVKENPKISREHTRVCIY